MREARHYVWADQVNHGKTTGHFPPLEARTHEGRLNHVNALGQDANYAIGILEGRYHDGR